VGNNESYESGPFFSGYGITMEPSSGKSQRKKVKGLLAAVRGSFDGGPKKKDKKPHT